MSALAELAPRRLMTADPLLTVEGLAVHFPFGNRWVGRRGVVRAVDGVDLEVRRGEILGLVGESGSGKTTLGRAVLRLVEPTSGSVRFGDADVRAAAGRELRALRRRMQIVFQDPYTALSPRMQIRRIIAEPMLLHRLVDKADADARVVELLRRVGLEPYMADRYPHEMSGGQRQRIAIARALSLGPELLIADEPVSALDVSVRAQVLRILLDLRAREGISILLISHDLAVVERVADRVAVMYRGRIVEEGPTRALMAAPLHPYTQALLSAVPEPDPDRPSRRIRLRDENGGGLPTGCPFAGRCLEAQERCRTEAPLLELKGTARHRAACHFR